jgi:hypothetical protein
VATAGKTFDLMASALPIGTLAPVTSVLAAILSHGNRDNLVESNQALHE